jgi:hypothetical protein
LELLDLSHCAGLLGKPAKLQLDDMQAALPNLRVLKLTGLGGLYGELIVRLLLLLLLLLLQGDRAGVAEEPVVCSRTGLIAGRSLCCATSRHVHAVDLPLTTVLLLLALLLVRRLASRHPQRCVSAGVPCAGVPAHRLRPVSTTQRPHGAARWVLVCE